MITIRPVRFEDFETICGHRRRMFAEMGTDPAILEAASAHYALWLEPRLKDGRYFGFLAEENCAVAGGIGLRMMDFPPNPLHPATDRRGFVLDMYVDPNYRRRGIAADLLRRGEGELLLRGATYATLQASDAGRPLYEKLGWKTTTEMGKLLR